MTEAVLVVSETVDRVAVIRLDDPASRNSLTERMLLELGAVLDRAAQDPDVGACVLAGGERYFASGANLQELGELSATTYLRGARPAAWRAIREFPKPLIAAVAGYAFGGGCELALTADALVAGDRVRFGQPEVKVGLLPAAGGTQRWARTCGRYVAAPIVMSGRTVTAWEARDLGLVERIVPDEHVVEAAADLARTFFAGAPMAVRLAKLALRGSEELSEEAALAQERTLLAALLGSHDLHEGVDAFLEKRTPDFQGR